MIAVLSRFFNWRFMHVISVAYLYLGIYVDINIHFSFLRSIYNKGFLRFRNNILKYYMSSLSTYICQCSFVCLIYCSMVDELSACSSNSNYSYYIFDRFFYLLIEGSDKFIYNIRARS